MNRADLVAILAAKNDLSKVAANAVLDTLIDTIQTAVKKGDAVQLVGFGTFKSAKRKPCVCVLMEMSCQAAMLPLATNSSGTSPFSATTVCTVNAGRAAVLSAASVLGEHAVTRLPPKARAMARAMSERYWSFFMVFCWRCVAIYLMAAWGRFG